MSETTYYQRNREVILNRAKDYYENNKELIRERAKNKYRELSEEERNIEREYGKKRYHNMSEENKKKLKEYQKNMANGPYFFRSFMIKWCSNNIIKVLCMANGPYMKVFYYY